MVWLWFHRPPVAGYKSQRSSIVVISTSNMRPSITINLMILEVLRMCGTGRGRSYNSAPVSCAINLFVQCTNIIKDIIDSCQYWHIVIPTRLIINRNLMRSSCKTQCVGTQLPPRYREDCWLRFDWTSYTFPLWGYNDLMRFWQLWQISRSLWHNCCQRSRLSC